MATATMIIKTIKLTSSSDRRGCGPTGGGSLCTRTDDAEDVVEREFDSNM